MVAKPERPSLAGLPLKKKATFAPGPAEVEQDTAPSPQAAEPKPDGKVPVMVRMTRADRKVLRQIALGMDTSVQALIEEAMHDIIRRHRGAMNF
jgi:hypothetical protein